MNIEPNAPTVRPADLTGPDAGAVSRLVEAYLTQTEREKATHLGETSAGVDLPERYRDEVKHPARSYENAIVYVAELGDALVGLAVVKQTDTSSTRNQAGLG